MPGSSLSRKILIGIMALFILSLLGVMGMLEKWLVVTPHLLLPGLELWRVITYPLGPTLLGLVIGGITFSAPAEEVEQMLGSRAFGMLLLVITVVIAIVHTAIFFGQTGPVLEGPANIALFVLVGFVYLFPQSEIRILFFNIRSWTLLVTTGVIVLFYSLYMWLEHAAGPMEFFVNGGFGMLFGAIFFHARYQKYTFLLRQIRSVERIAVRVRSSGGAASPSAAPRRAAAPQAARIRMPFQKTVTRELTDEERLNLILERISEKGYSALTEEERRFLSEYSNRLK